jgi:hypothetical protein
MLVMTIERDGWYSGKTVQTVEVADLEAAGKAFGYGSGIFARRADGAFYADLTDYRFGESAYVCRVTVRPQPAATEEV